MFTLKYLRYIPRVCHPYYVNFCRSYCSQVDNILQNLERTIKSEEKIDLTGYLQELKRINVQWCKTQGSQKLLSSVLHGLLSTERFDELLILINYLKSVNYEMWSGMSSIVLKTYAMLNMWDEAVNQYETMKKDDQIKHVRTLGEFVTLLAADNQVILALKYFKELQQQELILKTSKFEKPDLAMLEELLNAVNRQSNHTMKLTKGESILNNPMSDPVSEVMEAILKYMEFWDVKPSSSIANLIVKWYSNRAFPISQSQLQNSICHSCGTDLRNSYKDICEHVVSSIRKSCTNMHADLQYLDLLLKQNNEIFHVIVDAGNLLFDENYKDKKQINIESLENGLNNLSKFYSKSFLNVAVVFPQSFSRPDKLKPFSFLNKIATDNVLNFKLSVIPLRRINDDIVLCYLTARSELKLLHYGMSPVLVTNDNFYNHRFIVDNNKQGEFLNWIQHRKQPFHERAANLKDLKYVKFSNDNVHLIDEGKSLFCIKRMAPTGGS